MVDSTCIVVVTHRRTDGILKYVKNVRPVYNILEPKGDLETSEALAFNEELRQSIWLSNFSFQRTILYTMNEGCSAYIFQTAKPKAMLRIIADLLRRSIARMNRKFIFIPPTHIFTGWPHTRNEYSNEKEIFSMKETSFIPGIIILRPALLEYPELSSNKCSEKPFKENYFIPVKGQLQTTHLQDTIWLFSGEESISNIKNNTLLRAMKNYAVKEYGLKLGMKVKNYLHCKEFTSTCEPRCPQMQAGLVVEAITHRFSYPDPSGSRVLARWSVTSGVQHVRNLFPDKLTDLGGRPLTVVTLDYLPYSIMEFMDRKDVDDGTEFLLIRQLALRLNFTWKKVLDPEYLWGEIQEDGTGNGVAGLVSEDRAELGFGSMYLWHSIYRFVDFTYPHVISAVTCLVPRPRLLPAWKVPVLPLSTWSWAAVSGSLVVTMVALHVVAKAEAAYLGSATCDRFTTLTDSALRTVGLLVLQMPEEDNQHVAVRHLMLWLGFMYLLITSSYCAGLSSVLTLPRYEPPINTVTDLAQRGTLWAANHEAWLTYIADAEDPVLQTVNRNFRVYNDSILEQKSAENEIAFPIERLFGGNFAVSDYIRPEFIGDYRLMKEDLYRPYCTMVVRKGSPYTEKMNQLVHSVLSSGLWYHWEGEVSRRFLSQKVQLTIAISAFTKEEGPKKLRLQHIEGALALLVSGLAFSFLVLLLEILHHSKHPSRH